VEGFNVITSIDEREFQIIYRDFRRISSNLLNANFQDANLELQRFLNFINETPLIKSFIDKHNTITFDESRFEPQTQVYELPINKSEEIAFIYQLLMYHNSKQTEYWKIGYAYGYKKLQDHVQGFNDRVVKRLYNHILDYLGDIAMDNDFDRRSKTEIKVTTSGNQSPVVIGNEGSNVQSTININNTQTQDAVKTIEELITALKSTNEIDEELKLVTLGLADAVKENIVNEKQNEGLIKALNQKLNEINAITSTSSALSSIVNTAITLFNQLTS
jgi:hypothetical protein